MSTPAPRHPRVRNLQYQRALEDLEAHAPAATQRCRLGCASCCRGPFDVSTADVWLALEGLGGLGDAARADVFARIKCAVRSQRDALGVARPAEIAIDVVGEARFDAMCDALSGEPCVFLDGDRCRIPQQRPQPCRMRGAVWTGPRGDEIDLRCAELGGTRVVFDVGAFDVHARLFDRGAPLPDLRYARTTLATGMRAVLVSGSG